MKKEKTKSKKIRSMNEYYLDDEALADLPIAETMTEAKKPARRYEDDN